MAMLKLMHDRLEPEQVHRLLAMQANGGFFTVEPQCNFGSHALAWAAGLQQLDVLKAAMDFGHREWATWTGKFGFAPIHVAAFRNHISVIRFLVDEFGADQLELEGAGGFSPLLIAARMGHTKAVQACLLYDRLQKWSWGPLACFNLEIRPMVDSHVTCARTTLLEVLVRPDASTKTKAMLLDSFMTGTLFRLFEIKWHFHAKLWFRVSTTMLAAYVLVLTVLASPDLRDEATIKPLAWATLALACFLAEEEVREIRLWLLHCSAEERKAQATSPSIRVQGVAVTFVRLMALRGAPLRYTSIVCTLTACGLLLGSTSAESAAVRVLLGVASLTGWGVLSVQSFTRSSRFGVFNILIYRMLRDDIVKFFAVFIPIVLAFATAMNALHPDLRYSRLWTSINTLFMMSFVGESLSMNADSGPFYDPGAFGDDGDAAAIVFYLCYLCFLILSAVLMVNLLIAMMSTTYEATQLDATREWRVMFSRMVLRMELLTPQCLTRLTGDARDVPFEYVTNEDDLPGTDPFHDMDSETHEMPQTTNRYQLMVRMHEHLLRLESGQRAIQAHLGMSRASTLPPNVSEKQIDRPITGKEEACTSSTC